MTRAEEDKKNPLEQKNKIQFYLQALKIKPWYIINVLALFEKIYLANKTNSFIEIENIVNHWYGYIIISMWKMNRMISFRAENNQTKVDKPTKELFRTVIRNELATTYYSLFRHDPIDLHKDKKNKGIQIETLKTTCPFNNN